MVTDVGFFLSPFQTWIVINERSHVMKTADLFGHLHQMENGQLSWVS